MIMTTICSGEPKWSSFLEKFQKTRPVGYVIAEHSTFDQVENADAIHLVLGALPDKCLISLITNTDTFTVISPHSADITVRNKRPLLRQTPDHKTPHSTVG